MARLGAGQARRHHGDGDDLVMSASAREISKFKDETLSAPTVLDERESVQRREMTYFHDYVSQIRTIIPVLCARSR